MYIKICLSMTEWWFNTRTLALFPFIVMVTTFEMQASFMCSIGVFHAISPLESSRLRSRWASRRAAIVMCSISYFQTIYKQSWILKNVIVYMIFKKQMFKVFLVLRLQCCYNNDG